MKDNSYIEECCTCFKKNVVKTKCGHNLCRCCFVALYPDDDQKEILCPVCNTILERNIKY